MNEAAARSGLSRRQLLTTIAALGVGPLANSIGAAGAPKIRFGYAAITWGGNDRQAIEDIAGVGFSGIQLRQSALKEWGSRPGELKDLLARHGLTMVALSSGELDVDSKDDEEQLTIHARHAAFVRDVGGLYLQILDSRPKGRTIVAADYARMGHLLTELGKRTSDLGIPLGYHNHLGAVGERPDEVDRILDAADPRVVHLELDIAHYQQAGGDPAMAVQRHSGRLLFLHIKDVVSPTPDPDGYLFVELGRGKVDLPAVFRALDQVKFDGWAIVELDSVSVPGRTPRDSALVSKKYIEDKLGLRI